MGISLSKFGKISQFGKFLKLFGKLLWVYLGCGKILTLYIDKFLILSVVNGLILKTILTLDHTDGNRDCTIGSFTFFFTHKSLQPLHISGQVCVVRSAQTTTTAIRKYREAPAFRATVATTGTTTTQETATQTPATVSSASSTRRAPIANTVKPDSGVTLSGVFARNAFVTSSARIRRTSTAIASPETATACQTLKEGNVIGKLVMSVLYLGLNKINRVGLSGRELNR